MNSLKIQIVSDLHIEFREKQIDFLPVTGDVLILAGDVCTLGDAKMRDVFVSFIELCLTRYEKIFHVAGNHEFWNEGKGKTTMREIANFLKSVNKKYPNYVFLNNSCFEFARNGKKYYFVGSTLWAHADKKDYVKLHELMCDYDSIYVDSGSEKVKLSVARTVQMHAASRRFMKNAIDSAPRNANIILVVHHSPIVYSSGKLRERNIDPLGYESDVLPQLKLKNVRLVVHGHVHVANRTMLGSTIIVSNPRGYPYERTEFDPKLCITL